MLKLTITLILLLFHVVGYTQSSEPYCINEIAGTYSLANINPQTGVVNNIGVVFGFSFYILGNKHCVNTHDNTFTFSGYDGNNAILFTVDLATGTTINSPVFNGVVVGLRYNCEDSTIYAIEENGGGYDLVKVDKTTGFTTTIGFISGVSGYVGDSFVLDTKRGVYHFFGLFGPSIKMFSVDINTGVVTASPFFPDNLAGLAYNCEDSTAYGLWEDGTDYMLEKIDPTTGTHTSVGVMTNIDPGYVSESSTINSNGEYIYRGFSNTNPVLLTVDLQTANVINNVPFSATVSGVDFYSCCSDIITSLPENKKNRAGLFPNPFVNNVTLNWDVNVKNGELNLFNALGEMVLTENNINGISFQLKRNKIPNGLYFIQVKENNKIIWSDKLIAN
jgi:Secretion system C-terminal sorting domain